MVYARSPSSVGRPAGRADRMACRHRGAVGGRPVRAGLAAGPSHTGAAADSALFALPDPEVRAGPLPRRPPRLVVRIRAYTSRDFTGSPRPSCSRPPASGGWFHSPCPALAAVLALFTAAATAVARRAPPGWPMALTLAGAWVLTDLARQFVATGFPWNPLGSVWELSGHVGRCADPAGLADRRARHDLRHRAVGGDSGSRAGVGGLPASGCCRSGAVSASPPATKTAARSGCDGAVDPGQRGTGPEMGCDPAGRHLSTLLSLTREAVAAAGDSPAVVVWPETASPALLQTDAAARDLIAQALGEHQALIGAVRFDAARRPRNSLFALGAGGVIQGIYDKWHLVPFGEYQPDWLPWASRLCPGGGFARGPGPRTLHLPGLPPVGALICYEAIFPNQVIDEADRPGLDDQRDQRRLVRQFRRPQTAPCRGSAARGRGRLPAAARGKHGYLGRIRRQRP